MGVHKGMKFQASKASSSLSMRKPHWYSGYRFLQWVLGIMGRRCYRGGLWSDYRGLWCHKKEIFSFSFKPKGYLSLSCNPWALNHRRYWETTHLVTGHRVQFSWVGPQHLAHEASQIWQWPCSSMYSPGEQNLVVYLISTCQCCVGC